MQHRIGRTVVLCLVVVFLSAACRQSSTQPDEIPAVTAPTSAALRPATPSAPPFFAAGLTATSSYTEPLAPEEIAFWAYQLQDISRPGAVEALVDSHYDILVLEPTRTDWSSDDKFFDTRGMVAQLKSSKASDGVHRKLVIAYLNIGQAEDWRWYWTWSTGWDCTGDAPADWPDYILACDDVLHWNGYCQCNTGAFFPRFPKIRGFDHRSWRGAFC